MRRDSLDTKIERAPFQAKLLNECRSCHSIGIKPGVLDTQLGDYGVRDMLPRRYNVLSLNEAGLCSVCETALSGGSVGT
jgi:hypothetical protein